MDYSYFCCLHLPVLTEPLINSSARSPVLFVNDCVTVSRRSPAAPSSHFLVIRKKLSAIAQTHYISGSSNSVGAGTRSSMMDFSTRSINGFWFSCMAWMTAFFSSTGTVSRGQADTDRAAMPMACS